MEERGEIIAEYERSGLTQAKFVERRGISLASLSNWLRAHRQDGRKSAGKEVAFAPVDINRVLGGSVWAAEVAMPNGITVRLGAQVNPELAQRLIKAAQRSC